MAFAGGDCDVRNSRGNPSPFHCISATEADDASRRLYHRRGVVAPAAEDVPGLADEGKNGEKRKATTGKANCAGRRAMLLAFLLVVWAVVKARHPELQVRGARRRNLRSEQGQPYPFNPDCPFVIPTEKEALRRGRDHSIPGNVLVVTNWRHERLGNRIMSLYRSLSLGYCCKSKMVSLPQKDFILAPGKFNEGTPGPRWFDFSSSPDVEGFNASSCPSKIKWGGKDPFFLSPLGDEKHRYFTPGLQECIKTVPRLKGCEAAYYFPMDIDICGSDKENDVRGNVTIQRGEVHTVETDEGARGKDGGVAEEQTRRGNADTGENLAIHVRSGDIFKTRVNPGYGQPPWQYYLRALEDRKWDRVDIVTNGKVDSKHGLNPVIPALESKLVQGELPGNTHLHKDRSMAEDLVTMLCADALVTARSSVTKLLAYHSVATRMYFPTSCRGGIKGFVEEHPDIKVYGMLSRQDDYSPYLHWKNTLNQLAETMNFEVPGFQHCNNGS